MNSKLFILVFFLLLIHILVNISIIIDMKVDTPKNVASERNKVTGTYQHASFVFQRRLHDFVCFCFQCVSCWMFLFSLFKRMSSIVSCFHFVFIFGSIPSEKLLLLHLYTNKLKMLKAFHMLELEFVIRFIIIIIISIRQKPVERMKSGLVSNF